jgi:hypothetical protein
MVLSAHATPIGLTVNYSHCQMRSLALVALVLGATACSASNRDARQDRRSVATLSSDVESAIESGTTVLAAPAGSNQTAPAVSQPFYSLNEYVQITYQSDDVLLENARQKLVENCMHEAGFDWFELPDSVARPVVPIGFGRQLSLDDATISGYGDGHGTPESAPDELGQKLASSPGATDASAQCADELLNVPELRDLEAVRLQFIDDPPMAQVLSSDLSGTLATAWRQCMLAAGYDSFPEPSDAVFAAGEMERAQALSLARADAACQASSEYYPKLNAALREATLRWIDEHQGVLNELATAYDSALRWASKQ